MLIIREKFIAKPGQASKLAKLMKEAFEGSKARVMTDFTGSYNTVVVETEMESLGEFEKMMQEYAETPKFSEKMKGYHDMFYSGSRQIFRVLE